MSVTDLGAVLLNQVLDTILQKCGLQLEGATASEPLKLEAHGRSTAMTMSQKVTCPHKNVSPRDRWLIDI